MALFLKKKQVVGVSVDPEVGLEVAQIDIESKIVLKYGSKRLAYDNLRREISDLDIFKDTLQELLTELDIPKGSDVVLNFPTVAFNVTDYPASMNKEQINMAIEEELLAHQVLQDTEVATSFVVLPNSNIQFSKVAYTALPKTMLIEIAIQIKDLGYKLIGIDTSVNSTLNALIYNEHVDVTPDVNWIMLLVEANACRIISMSGRTYVDSFEELISIGEVLGDDENYSTVLNAVNPIIKNIPTQRLHVVSKTSLISAKKLSENLETKAQIIYQEANLYSETSFLDTSPYIESEVAKSITLDVIGAAINRDFLECSVAPINLYNDSLGDVYILEQPPKIKIADKYYVLSLENTLPLAIGLSLIIGLITLVTLIPLNQIINQNKNQIAEIEKEISIAQSFLDQHKDISTDVFNEADEIRIGLTHNKGVYSYFTIVGTEIPQKLWLTKLSFGENTTIEGQADNIESVYSFFRSIKDYDPDSKIKLQKLGLAAQPKLKELSDEGTFDTDSIITSMNADFYTFRISDAPEISKTDLEKNKKGSNRKKKASELEPLD